jgi:hypothetical protein
MMGDEGCRLNLALITGGGWAQGEENYVIMASTHKFKQRLGVHEVRFGGIDEL